jgi:hypothetical protein
MIRESEPACDIVNKRGTWRIAGEPAPTVVATVVLP